MLSPEFFHALSVVVAIVLGGIGSGIGQGIAGYGALTSITRQSASTSHIVRTMILGLALIESGVILALVISLMILFAGGPQLTLGVGLAELGMGLAIGLSSLAISIASAFAVKTACQSIARQPFFQQKIVTIMLLSQSIVSAPAIFAFIIALLIKVQIREALTVVDGIKFLAAGATIGVGSIGPSIGQGIFSSASCRAAGLNKKNFGKLLPFSLLSQAVIQTPLIFCLIIAIMIVYKDSSAISSEFISAVTFFSPSFAISVGSLGTAIAIGYAASKSCFSVVMDEENYSIFVRTSLLAQAIIESAAIYALIVSLVMMTKTL